MENRSLKLPEIPRSEQTPLVQHLLQIILEQEKGIEGLEEQVLRLKRETVKLKINPSRLEQDCYHALAHANTGLRRNPTLRANFRTLLRLHLLVACFSCGGSALALSPPLITDDPETPGADGWEINITSSVEQTREQTFIEAPLFDINYGVVDNDQLKIEFAVASVDVPDEQNHWGISDLLVGYKYRFLEEDEGIGWQVSFYPQVSTPTGNAELGIGEGVTELEIPFQFGKHYFDEKLYVNPEVGYNVVFESDDLNSWKFGLAAEIKATERLEVMGEVGAFVFPQDSEPDDPFFNFGFEYIINEHVALLGSAGRSFRPRSDGTPDLRALIGFELTFGGRGEENEGSARAVSRTRNSHASLVLEQ